MKIPLKDKLVHNVSLYENPTFRLILNFLIANRFEFRTDYIQFNSLIMSFGKIYWRGGDNILLPDSGAKYDKIGAEDIMHSGMHFMVSNHFGKNLKAIPKLTIYAECLASCTDLYFSLIYYHSHGVTHPKVSRYLQTLEQVQSRTGLPYLNRFNQCLHNPFKAYQEAVEEIFSFTLLLAESAKGRNPYKFEYPNKIEKRIRKMKYYPLLAHLDFVTFVLYSETFCGATSSKDQNSLKKCSTFLSKSKTMDEFIQKLTTPPYSSKSQK